MLSRSLRTAVEAIADGATDVEIVVSQMVELFDAEPLAELDYAAVVDASTLQPVTEIGDNVRILVAAQVGPARLIDNADARSGRGLPAL